MPGLAAAFFIVGEAPFIPVRLGTNAHLLGGALAVALLGPYLGALTITTVCILQALLFGSGGITTLGTTVTGARARAGVHRLSDPARAARTVAVAVAAGVTAAVCVLLSRAPLHRVHDARFASGIDRSTFAASRSARTPWSR